ncbi:hypothetical protein P5673_015719 [Acropora cervicornis]|uniref:Uncharacterized protein n=1 Tax=Acropora cervicornis TaxID=6130 RepID=A0AAD9QHY0_ACRCE|nr:hypothetical protein P5673_015719 [Acropora cervicornis]
MDIKSVKNHWMLPPLKAERQYLISRITRRKLCFEGEIIVVIGRSRGGRDEKPTNELPVACPRTNYGALGNQSAAKRK